MTRSPLAVLALLAACTAPPEAPVGAARIVVASGGSMFGSTAVTIFADGTVIADNATAGGRPQHSVSKGSSAVYDAAAAVIAREGAATKAAPRTDSEFCTDYGTDQVRAEPPIGGFDAVMTACPNDAVTALMDHILATLATK